MKDILHLIQRTQHLFKVGSLQKVTTVLKIKELDVIQCSLSIPANKVISIDCEEFEVQLKHIQVGNPLTESHDVHFIYENIPITITVQTITLIEEKSGIIELFTNFHLINCGKITEATKFIFETNEKILS